MRVIVEIDEEIYEHARTKSEDSNDEWNAMRAIANSIPLPANPTNGDVVKAMFPDARILDMSEVGVVQLVWEGIDVFLGESRNFSCDWWNASYKEVKADEI